MPKKNSSVVQGNTIYNSKPCSPDDYLSPANRIQRDAESLLKCNSKARLIEKDCCRDNQYGLPLPWNEEAQRNFAIRQRYRREFDEPGQSNRDKSKNNIY